MSLIYSANWGNCSEFHMRNKDRLYLILYHRYDKPGYHWAFLLAPKDSDRDEELTSNRDSLRLDISNLKSHTWLFRSEKINQLSDMSLIARVILAKFPAKKRQYTAALLEEKLRSVEIRQDDLSFTCRTWALDGVRALLDQSIIRVNIPIEELENVARTFADDVMKRIIAGTLVIERQSAIPVLNLRK